MPAKPGKQSLLPAYLAVGEDALKRRTVAERLRARVAKESDLSFNRDTFDGSSADGAAIVDACNTLPFASPLRLVEVSNVGKLPKSAADAVAAYLANPCESTVLALYGEKLAKNTKLYKAVAKLGKSAVIDCAPMKARELERAVRSMATGHGFTMTQAAAARLVELVGQDTVRLDSELAKLAMAHRGSDAVTDAEVSALVSATAEAKPWEFVDAFAARNVPKCLALRPQLSGTSPYALLAMCTTRVRELICAQSLVARGQRAGIAQALHMPPWRVKNHALWASRFGRGELERALVTSRDAERAMKSGADPEEAFMRWVVDVAAPARR